MKQTPSLGLEYQRRLQKVKFAAAMYELMIKQLEAARLDESRETMVVQVIDVSTPPDYTFKPKRTACRRPALGSHSADAVTRMTHSMGYQHQGLRGRNEALPKSLREILMGTRQTVFSRREWRLVILFSTCYDAKASAKFEA